MVKCCDIHAGMLRTPVRFERVTRTADGFGGWAEAWGVIPGAPQWALVEDQGGGEGLRADRLDAIETARVTVRYTATITAADRVVIDGRPWQIRRVSDVERRRQWHVLTCEGGVAP